MRKVQTLTREDQTAVVFKTEDEFIVRFFLNGEHLVNADYHTDLGEGGKADAIGTAKAEIARTWNVPEVQREIQVSHIVTDELASDVMSTCAEGGSTYWAEFRVVANRKTELGPTWSSVLIVDAENEEETHRAGLETIRLGITRILQNTDVCRADIRVSVFQALSENDAGNIDAEIADVILQVGLFDEVIYG